MRHDVCIIGGGLVGLAVGRALADAHDGISLLVVEKEHDVALHQSGHNSGVVHSGLYYRPGSLKARLCVEGRRAIEAMAEDGVVRYRRSGKLVIAVDSSEVPALDELERRGRSNGLKGLRRLRRNEIAEFEPAAAGLSALHVPEAGVVDFGEIARLHVERLVGAGATIVTGFEVQAIEHRDGGAAVVGDGGRFAARILVNCAGLHSDTVARMTGIAPPVRIIPFRGEYYRLTEEAARLVRTLIYPVPDPRFPFLGVHFTRRVEDVVEVGPNAVLALGREHYRGTSADWSELLTIVRHRGFRRLAARHWAAGTKELVNSRSRARYARLARRLVPELASQDLEPGGVGVRAQAVDVAGNLVDDFVIEQAGSTLHVLNAPSPGATASIAIGRHVAERLRPLLSG